MKPAPVNTLTPLPSTPPFPTTETFARYGTLGDGSCFFHSVCAAHNVEGYLFATPAEQQRIGHAYRCRFTDHHITPATWAAHAPTHKLKWSVEEARTKFGTSTTWATRGMIQFVATVLKLNLIFVDTSTNTVHCGVHGKPSDPMIIILWVDQSHFEPVARVVSTTDNATAVQFVFDAGRDKEIVSYFTKQFNQKCKR